MTQQQITDAQRNNEVAFAALRGEVQQQRLEDIERQQGQRFEDVMRFGQILDRKFRGNPTDVESVGFKGNVPGTILLGNVKPDVEEKEFTQTLNEGAPAFKREPITEIFSEKEEEQGGLPLRPQGKISGGSMSSAAAEALGMPESFVAKTKKSTKPKAKLVRDPQDAANELGLGKIPTMRNTYTAIEDYYIALTDLEGDRDVSLNSKSQILAEINKILEAQL